MGFARTPSPHVIQSAKVVKFVAEREIDAVIRTVDPFGVDDTCEANPTGQHYGIGSCGEVVCCYCAKVFWQ